MCKLSTLSIQTNWQDVTATEMEMNIYKSVVTCKLNVYITFKFQGGTANTVLLNATCRAQH